ncbi:MAG: ABC transporter substrate-binding protein [Caldimonas sp.]
MRRSKWSRALLASLLTSVQIAGGAAGPAEPAQPAAPHVLRYAFPAAETGFDPTQLSDLYSRTVTTHIFSALYRYDYLARPFKIVPDAAAAMPEISDDFRTFTIRIKPGIYFADDPAFNGKKRELVAEDYVYSLKRFFDPANKAQGYTGLREEGMLGLEAVREAALRNKAPFDYDVQVEGLRALDRYTLRFKLETPRPRFVYTIADGSLFGALAREVVEFYRDKIMEHPVGSGPFRLGQWRRSSLIVLERNPVYREQVYDAQPNADDADGQALLQRFAGRRLPMLDRVEISIIEESQPRWLAFLNSQFDLIAVPLEFANVAAPNGKLAPNLAKRSIGSQRTVAAERTFFYFNMEDPVVGGNAPDKVALRRAIGLATDVEREIRIVRRGQAIAAQSIVAPNTYGYSPDYRSTNSEYSVAKAKALLDLYGYVDRNGDGWRDLPDGRSLTIAFATQPDQISRQIDEMWKKNMDAIGVRINLEKGQWPEQLKKARAGKLMVWQLGLQASSPDVQDGFQTLFGPSAGSQNLSRFKLPAFDAIYTRMQTLPDGPERLAAIAEANRLATAYMPQKYNVHRIATDLTQPWLIGYRRPAFGNQFWQYVDVDPERREQAH